MIYHSIHLPYRKRWSFANREYGMVVELPSNIAVHTLPQACEIEVGEDYILITSIPRRRPR